MHYSAIVPCVIAALTGFKISSHFGVAPMAVAVRDCNIDVMLFIKAAVLAILCGLLSIVFCFVLKNTGVLYKKFIKNSYLRIFTGGILVASLTFICGTYDYNGAGGAVIIRSFGESAPFYEFMLKLLFTTLTLGAGFKLSLIHILNTFWLKKSFRTEFSGLPLQYLHHDSPDKSEVMSLLPHLFRRTRCTYPFCLS